MQEGDIYFVEIPASNGHEQAGLRPAIIIQSSGNLSRIKYANLWGYRDSILKRTASQRTRMTSGFYYCRYGRGISIYGQAVHHGIVRIGDKKMECNSISSRLDFETSRFNKLY